MFYLFSGIFMLPVLIAQWVGVVKLAKHGRSGAWWCMVTGTVLTTLGPVLQIAGIFLLTLMETSPNMSAYHDVIRFGGFSGMGPLLFAIGFAIHAVRLSGMRERITELEMMHLAQATELERIRNR
jgi:hypothetical protein